MNTFETMMKELINHGITVLRFENQTTFTWTLEDGIMTCARAQHSLDLRDPKSMKTLEGIFKFCMENANCSDCPVHGYED
jgi:hypothetical protein